jgi:hypothetical protein
MHLQTLHRYLWGRGFDPSQNRSECSRDSYFGPQSSWSHPDRLKTVLEEDISLFVAEPAFAADREGDTLCLPQVG